MQGGPCFPADGAALRPSRWLQQHIGERAGGECSAAAPGGARVAMAVRRHPAGARAATPGESTGDTGKTTTAANLAASLARLSLPAVAVDADAGLRNLDLLLGLENRVHLTAADVLAGDCRLDQALVRHRALQDLQLLCLSKPRSKLPLAFGSKTLTWVADALRRAPNPPAFILIDCPAGR